MYQTRKPSNSSEKIQIWLVILVLFMMTGIMFSSCNHGLEFHAIFFTRNGSNTGYGVRELDHLCLSAHP